MPETDYQRLTRSHSRSGVAAAVVRRASLWLGRDHLLCIDTNGYSETYKRFYFRDIQAITVRETNRRAIWNWVLGILLTPCLAGLMTKLFQAGDHTVAIVIFAILSFLVALPLVINNVLGPTCICQLQTAVQTEELPSLSRIGRYNKVLDRLRPLIAASQGELLQPGEIPGRLRQMTETFAVGSVRTEVPAKTDLAAPEEPPVSHT